MRPLGPIFCGNRMDPGNHLSGHGDGCGSAPVKYAYGDKDVVVKGILDIARWADSDGSYCMDCIVLSVAS